MPNWTKEQQQAIDIEQNNIIVSAGAGSGKTAVLTERVLRKLRQQVGIDELLILTFTKAAAKEMKKRIREEIEKDETLKDQLDRLDAAYITTFDSYALTLVQKYHYLLGVPKDLAITDQSLMIRLKKQWMDQLIDLKYEEKDPLFEKVIGLFYTKDDKDFRESLLKINDKLDLKYDKVEYLENYVETYFRKEHLNQLKDRYVNSLIDRIHEIEYQLEQLQIEVEGTFYEAMLTVLTPLFEAKDYQSIKNSLLIKLPTLRNGTDRAKQIKETIYNLIKELRDSTTYEDETAIIETLISTQETVQVIVQLLLTFDRQVATYKKEKGLYEFIDISKMVIDLVQNFEAVREELKNTFNEVLVDEYQDTNDLQERFIRAITQNNCYMVGDIKQSIYRFRNANPTIFKEKYEKYQRKDGGIAIDLNKNFRSRREVLDNINLLFDRIMDRRLGGADYQANHRLIFGNNSYIEEGAVEEDCNIEVKMYPYSKETAYKKEEIEAFLIAQDIKMKIERGYKVYDRTLKQLRPLTYQDIVILIDRSTNFDLYKKIFTYLKIPLSIEKEENMTQEMDLALIKNIVHLIIQTKKNDRDTSFQFSYVAVARSYLYRASDEEILNILTTKEYNRLSLMEPVLKMASHLEEMTIQTLLEAILKEFPFDEKMITVGNVAARIYRMEYLLNLARSLEEQGLTVYDLDTYLEDVLKQNIDIKYNIHETEGNSCKIMTIHKSKGLEFPICYYAGLYAKFNLQEVKDRFSYDAKEGFIVPYFKEGIGDTFVKSLVKEDYIEQEISEKIRLFYVALTRAKEKMILVLPEEKEEDREDTSLIDWSVRLKYRSFADILKSLSKTLTPYTKTISLDEIPLTTKYLETSSKEEKKLSFTEPDNLIEKPIDYFVESIEKTTFSKKENDLYSKEEMEQIELGKKFHAILEYVDLKNPDSTLPNFYLDKIKPLSNWEKVQKAKEIYHEYEFYDTEKEQHGIIDLLLILEDETIIVDYKLKYTNDSKYRDQVKGYQAYIEQKIPGKVRTYLYSILTSELKEIV